LFFIKSYNSAQLTENNVHTIIDDSRLWDLFLSGDDKVYAHFYRKYAEDLFAYGMQFTADRELVKDCIHDVFVRIYSNRSKLGKTDNVKFYLLLSLKNTLYNYFQKDKRSYNSEMVEPVYHAEYSIEDLIIQGEKDQERQERIIHILETLTPRQREAMFYRYVEGMELDHICELMDMNYQSVQNLIQRSLQRMKTVFREKGRNVLFSRLSSSPQHTQKKQSNE